MVVVWFGEAVIAALEVARVRLVVAQILVESWVIGRAAAGTACHGLEYDVVEVPWAGPLGVRGGRCQKNPTIPAGNILPFIKIKDRGDSSE